MRHRARKSSGWFRLAIAAAASELLYLWMARASAAPVAAAWGARWYAPRLFEETLPFWGSWSALIALYAWGVHLAGRFSGRGVTMLIFATSIVFRATLVPAPGFHAETLLASPLAELVERASSALSPFLPSADPEALQRAAMAGCDIAALALAPGLLKAAQLPSSFLLLYGWSPLAVKESAGSGRIEPAVLFLLALALAALRRARRGAGALAYGASLTGGIAGAPALPLLSRSLRAFAAIALAVAAGAYAIARDALAPPSFFTDSFFGGSIAPAAVGLARLFLTRNAIYPLAVCGAVWLLVVVYRALAFGSRPERVPLESLVAIGSFLMISPTVLPWWFLPVAFFSAFSPNRGWLVFTATAPLGYFAVGGGGWSFWLGFAQYFPAYFFLIFLWLGRPPGSLRA